MNQDREGKDRIRLNAHKFYIQMCRQAVSAFKHILMKRYPTSRYCALPNLSWLNCRIPWWRSENFRQSPSRGRRPDMIYSDWLQAGAYHRAPACPCSCSWWLRPDSAPSRRRPFDRRRGTLRLPPVSQFRGHYRLIAGWKTPAATVRPASCTSFFCRRR